MKKKSGNKAVWILGGVGVLGSVFLGLIYAGSWILITGYRPFQVVGVAMEPGYKKNEYVLAKQYVSEDVSLKNGDVITFYNPDGSTKVNLKRIIGSPADTIEIENGAVSRNGQILNEPYTAGTRTGEGIFATESAVLTIPNDSYFVLGDNREFSTDSRAFGPINKKDIVGKVLFCYWECK